MDQVAEADRLESVQRRCRQSERGQDAQCRVLRVTIGWVGIAQDGGAESGPLLDEILDQRLGFAHQAIEQALVRIAEESRAFLLESETGERGHSLRAAPAPPAQAIRCRDSPAPFHGALCPWIVLP